MIPPGAWKRGSLAGDRTSGAWGNVSVSSSLLEAWGWPKTAVDRIRKMKAPNMVIVHSSKFKLVSLIGKKYQKVATMAWSQYRNQYRRRCCYLGRIGRETIGDTSGWRRRRRRRRGRVRKKVFFFVFLFPFVRSPTLFLTSFVSPDRLRNCGDGSVKVLLVFLILANTGLYFWSKSTIQITRHEHLTHEHAKFQQAQE